MREFGTEAVDQSRVAVAREAVQCDRADVDVDLPSLHDQPRVSASLSGRSSLALSA